MGASINRRDRSERKEPGAQRPRRMPGISGFRAARGATIRPRNRFFQVSGREGQIKKAGLLYHPDRRKPAAAVVGRPIGLSEHMRPGDHYTGNSVEYYYETYLFYMQRYYQPCRLHVFATRIPKSNIPRPTEANHEQWGYIPRRCAYAGAAAY
jgi:hypothetical protein